MSRRRITKGVATLVASLGVFSLASLVFLTKPEQTRAEPGTLDWYAEQARHQGADTWEFGSGIFEYVEPRTWDEMLATQSLVVVEPIETRSYPNHDNTGIWSWWRFRIVEVLSQQDLSSCYTCSIPTVLPADFPPAQADQIVLEKYSGSLTHNGAWLTAVEPSFPEYVIGQRYLLILDLDPRDRSAAVRMGPLGVYRIDSAGNFACVCESVGRENPYRDELRLRYENSLANLRAALKIKLFPAARSSKNMRIDTLYIACLNPPLPTFCNSIKHAS